MTDKELEEVDRKALIIEKKYDRLMEQQPETIDEVEIREKQLNKLRMQMMGLIEEVRDYAEVEDFLVNGPGGKDID